MCANLSVTWWVFHSKNTQLDRLLPNGVILWVNKATSSSKTRPWLNRLSHILTESGSRRSQLVFGMAIFKIRLALHFSFTWRAGCRLPQFYFTESTHNICRFFFLFLSCNFFGFHTLYRYLRAPMHAHMHARKHINKQNCMWEENKISSVCRLIAVSIIL